MTLLTLRCVSHAHRNTSFLSFALLYTPKANQSHLASYSWNLPFQKMNPTYKRTTSAAFFVCGKTAAKKQRFVARLNLPAIWVRRLMQLDTVRARNPWYAPPGSWENHYRRADFTCIPPTPPLSRSSPKFMCDDGTNGKCIQCHFTINKKISNCIQRPT